MTRAVAGDTATCVCGAAIAFTKLGRWTHLEPVPKGQDPEHPATPDRRPSPAAERAFEVPVIRQQVDTLQHVVASLELEHAGPQELRDLIVIGVGLMSSAWQSSVAADFKALARSLEEWSRATAEEVRDATRH